MEKRESISKKKRFDIFKRDGFQCQYCGASPPEVVLEIDHIQPISKGGSNALDNLLTACFGCNRGKSNGLLQVAPEALADKAEKLAEKREQLKAYERLQKSIRKEQDKQIDELQEIMRTRHPGKVFSEKFKTDIRRQFMPRLAFFQIRDAMERAMTNATRGGCEGAVKYFCGICWKIIRGPE